MKPCISCPYNEGVTKEATIVQSFGCDLPNAREIRQQKRLTGNNWGCHCAPTTICRGLILDNDENGLGFDFEQGELIPGTTNDPLWVMFDENDNPC